MLFKRFTAFLLSSALIIGVMPAVVFADKIDFEADGTEISETSEEKAEETEKKIPETKKEKESAPEEETKPEDKEETKPETKDETEPEPDKESVPETKDEKVKETEEETSKATEADKAENPVVIKGKLPSESYKSSDSSDNDGLFGKYLEKKLYQKPARRGAKSIPSRGSELTGLNSLIYNSLVPQILAIAEGTKTSTELYISLDELGLKDTYWSKSDLGIKTVVKNGEITDEAYLAIKKKLQVDLKAINLSLLADYPCELYWYDKTEGVNLYYPTVEAVDFDDGKGFQLHFTDEMELDFTVAAAYSKNGKEFVTDPTKINKANTAIANVASIISEAAGKSDYDKLDYYRVWICDHVRYDFSALNSGTPYGDPWQIVSVFDGDNDTNVVCEGFSKAFKYLCDKTDFKGDISCITVTGDMYSDGGSGPHMWNIVRMDDGYYYLVDITNCDAGSAGYPNRLFLVGYSSCKVGSWYTIKFDGESIKYVYDDETKKIYTSELRIHNLNYKSSCGDNLMWRFDGNNLILTGSGDMPAWNSKDDVPWKYVGEYIKSVSLPDGLTSISDYTFSGFTEITSITIPSTVTSIGKEAFKGCTRLKTVYMDESLKTNVDPTAFDDCPNVVIQYYNTVDDYEYIITNPAVDGKGTVMLFGVANKKETVSIRAAVNINGVDYKVTRIHGKAFYKDTTVKSVFIGPNVTSIDSNAFYGCSKLVKVNGGSKLLTIGTSAFRACSKLKTFSISSTRLRKIGVMAFSGDKCLKTIQIKRTARLTKSGVKKSLKGSSVKTVKVKKSKLKKYRKYFKKSNSGRKVKVKK